MAECNEKQIDGWIRRGCLVITKMPEVAAGLEIERDERVIVLPSAYGRQDGDSVTAGEWHGG